MFSCSIWISAPSFWMGGGLESHCVGRVYGADGALHGTIRTVHTTYAYNIFCGLFETNQITQVRRYDGGS